jgi:DNA-binding Lrp family transcriptional regulator
MKRKPGHKKGTPLEPPWTREQLIFLVQNYGKMSSKKLAEGVGRSVSAVNLRIRKLCLAKRMKMDIEKDNKTMERWRREETLKITIDDFRICQMEEPVEGDTKFVCIECKGNHHMTFKFFKILLRLKVRSLKKLSNRLSKEDLSYNKALDDLLRSVGL